MSDNSQDSNEPNAEKTNTDNKSHTTVSSKDVSYANESNIANQPNLNAYVMVNDNMSIPTAPLYQDQIYSVIPQVLPMIPLNKWDNQLTIQPQIQHSNQYQNGTYSPLPSIPMHSLATQQHYMLTMLANGGLSNHNIIYQGNAPNMSFQQINVLPRSMANGNNLYYHQNFLQDQTKQGDKSFVAAELTDRVKAISLKNYRHNNVDNNSRSFINNNCNNAKPSRTFHNQRRGLNWLVQPQGTHPISRLPVHYSNHIPQQWSSHCPTVLMNNNMGSAYFGTYPLNSQPLFTNDKFQKHLQAENPSSILQRIKSKNNFNPKEFDMAKLNNARFFIIKSYAEDDIHRSIKYGIWCSTPSGNRRLNEAYREREGKGAIYLFFSVNESSHFCGIAEMVSPVDYDIKSGVWVQDKWQGKMDVQWLYIKDVPNVKLRHIHLENNCNKPVTFSRDAQEVPLEKAKQVFQIIHNYKEECSLLDDFDHYEIRQQEQYRMRKNVRKAPQFNNSKQVRHSYNSIKNIAETKAPDSTQNVP